MISLNRGMNDKGFFGMTLLILLIVIAINADAATRYSVSGGNWNSTARWSATSGGASGASVPGSTDDVVIEGGFTITLNASPVTVNSLTINGGTFEIGSNTARTFTVNGTVSVISGTLNLTTGNQIGTLNAGGDFTSTGGTITESGSASGSIVFNKAGTQTFTSGSTVSNTVNFTVNSGSILQMASPSTVVSGNSFTLSAGATLGVTSTAGISTAGATGNIQTTSRTYTAGAHYVYNGNANQIVGNGLTANNPGNFRVNNPGNTVSLGATTTLNGTLTITSGTLDTNGQVLTVTGLATVNGGNYLASTGTQSLNGGLSMPGGVFTGSTGAVTGTTITLSGGTFNAPSGVGTLTVTTGLVVSGGVFNGSTGSATLADVTLSSGTLVAPSGTFSVSGNWSKSGGTFTSGLNTVTFTKAAGTQTLATGGTPFNNISHTGTGTLQLITNALTTTGTFSSSAGSFDANALAHTVTGLATVSGGTYLASSATQTFNGGLTLSGTGVFTASSGAVTTGTGTLTVSGGTFSGSTGSVTVTDVLINGGTLSAPSGTFSVLGNWSRTSGTFTPGTNTVIFTKASGTQTLDSGGSSFYNISHTGAGILQLTTSNLSTTGSFSNSGGNFDPNGRTHTVTGIATISAGTYVSPTVAQTFNGGLTISGGTYSGSTGALTVTDVLLTSGTLTAPSGTFSVTTSFINNGGTFTAGANTVTFSGGAAKSVSGSSAITFNNVSMNTTGGAVVGIDRSVTINGTLSWAADGLLVVGATSDLTFGSAASITLPNSLRYIQIDGLSTVNSQVIRVSDGTAAKWQFLFPIGTSTGGYTPLNMTTATVSTPPTNNSTLAVKAILNTDAAGRMKRTFRMTVAGNANSTTFSGAQFSYNNAASPTGDISSGDSQANYNTIWYQKESLGTWTSLTGTAPGATFFTGPTVAQSLANDTYYFTIGSAIAYGGNVWYSYQSGNWNDPLTWTTDGSLFPLYVNPTNAIPGAADDVVITSGRTISMNVNNVSISSLTVTGVLDVLASTGHAFTTISGTGRIRMSAATDNFPGGTATNFADPAVGGTVEVNGTAMSLNIARTFNNLVINMTGSSNVATVLNTITLNGNLTVTNGLLTFNDNTAASRTFTVNGDVTVASTGGIRTGTGNARHEFNLYGDFTNNGTAYFTNRTSAITGSEATDGIVDFNLVSSTEDQSVSCNGVTRFYRIEINKGTDDTYIATIVASAAANFNLFGYANANVDTPSGSNDNALGLIAGTVQLGNNLTVLLNTTGNYAIFQAAKLWINGATVTKTGGNAVVPYGTLRVTSGSLTVDENSGLTLRVNGVINIEGGTVTVRAIRTSTAGAGAVGSYIQSGGNVIVTGGTISSDYATFSLTYVGNVFNMSGGTLTIRNRPDLGTGSLRGAIFINSDPANVSVTGGTVIMEETSNVSYRLTSRAAFWNVTMRKTGGTGTIIETIGTTSGTGTVGVDELTLAAQPLVVLNDFKVEGSTAVTFQTNNQNVTVSGNFEIQTGATYTAGTNTTTITGLGVSSVTLGTGATQVFNNLTINKSSASGEVKIIAGNATALRTSGTLTVSQGIFDYGSFIVSARGPVTLASGVSVGKSASTGKLLFDITSGAQTLTSSASTIYNMDINITGGSPTLTLSGGDLTVLKTLTMTAGIFNIGINKLSLSGASSVISGYSSARYIQSAGNASDGGVEMYVDANEALVYPLAVSGKYTPAEATFASFSDDGLVRIVPVDAILATTSGASADILSYYWNVSYSNFTTLPKVSYRYTYDNADIGGTEANYLPGKVLNVSPFTRSTDGDVTDVVDASNYLVFNGTTTGGSFPGVGFTLESANYTAGNSTRFVGTIDIYYSDVAGGYGNWETAGTWSKNAANGSGAQEVPVAGSVVVIQNGDRINVGNAIPATIANVAGVQFTFSGTPTSETVPRLQFYNNQTHSIGVVTGTGMISFNATNAPVVTGDFGDFGQNMDSYFLYFSTSGGPFTLSNTPTPIPNLMLESNTYTINQNITVNADLICQGEAIVIPGQNIRVMRDLLLGFWVGGTFRFPGTTPALTVTVDGDIDFTRDPLGNLGTTRALTVNSVATNVEHTLIVKGDILQGTGTLDLYNGSATSSRAALEFQGAGTNIYSRTSGGVPDLNRITCNKGSDQTSSFSLNNTVTLNAVTNSTVKAITISNGILKINNTGTYTLSSGGGNFDIPSTAGLEVSAGTVNMTTASTGLTLSGLLRINGGTATLDAGAGLDNFIEYSNTGTATIEVTSGSLTVGSQVRRSLVSNTGVLSYTQSGGTVVVGTRSAPNSTRGVFEITNTGSQFTHTGGSLTIVRGNGSSTVASVLLEPASSTISSGSTITIGNASTPAGNIGIQSTATLYNLAISGLAGSTPVAKLYVSPLVVSGNITVATGNTLDAQALDLTVGGNFTIDGTYTSGNNITTFNNSSAAAISGATSSLSFYNFTKSNAGTLTVSKDITINRDLKVYAGTIATSSFAINLKRHALVDAAITSTSGSGLTFNGTSQQQLSRSASGTGALGILTINNSTGVMIPDGNGYDFSVSGNLRLQSGVFDIGGSLLSLGASALITPVSIFNVTNMIQTNSSFTDKGVKKQFPTNYTTNFTFPVGQLNYTPVTFDFATPGNTTGTSGTPTITVRPANERHPSVIEDTEPVTQIVDANNVLQYYWKINADNVAATFRSSMALQYVQSLVAVASPYTEADYLSAQIRSDANPTIIINKFNTADVNETTNVITYTFSGVTDQGISGDYFAGVDEAIPSNVPIYTTTSSGNVNAAIYTPAVIGGGAPAGALVIVQSGHTLTFNTNNISLYETQINAGGKLVIPSGSIGHRLGGVSGTGDLEIDSNTASAVLPAAEYDVFFSCAGGGLIYGGSGTYDILGSITTLKKLTLEGAGTKTLANNDITICNDFTLNGGTFSNSNSRTVTVQNDVLLNASTYNNLGGTLTITRDIVQTAGAFDGGTGGTKTIGRDLNVTAGTFTPGSGSSNIIRVNGNMTVAGAATIVSGTGGVTGQRFLFGGSAAQSLTGTFTGTRAFNRLEISNSSGLTLAGNATINNELLLTTGNITTGSNTFLLELAGISTPSAGSSTSFVNGKLSKVMSNGQSFTFPIGRSTRWRSGEVNSVSQSGSVTWSMEFFLGSPIGAVASAPAPRNTAINNQTSSDATILKIGGDGYWRVYDGSATSNGRTAKVGLSWGIESDVSPNLAQREALTVMSWNGVDWTNNGGTNFQPGGAHTQSRGSFLSISTLSFSENIVMLGSTEVANPLPISLAWFKGEIVAGQGYLYWRTESEKNNDYFEIQRSNKDGEFAVIGKVLGKGTTNKASDYGFEDNDLQIGKNYYRLKQVDYDGKTSYSKVIVLEYDGVAHLGVRVFPNPTTNSNINFKVLSSKVEGTIVRLFDMTGKIIYKAEVKPEMIGEDVQIEAGSVKGGMYVLEVIQGKSRATQRIIIRD